MKGNKIVFSKGICIVSFLLLISIVYGCSSSNPYYGLAMDAGDFRNVKFGDPPAIVKQVEKSGVLTSNMNAKEMEKLVEEGGYGISGLGQSDSQMLVYENVPVGKDTATVVYCFEKNALCIGTIQISSKEAEKTYNAMKKYYTELLGEPAKLTAGGCQYNVEGKYLFLSRNSSENRVLIIVMDMRDFENFLKKYE